MKRTLFLLVILSLCACKSVTSPARQAEASEMPLTAISLPTATFLPPTETSIPPSATPSPTPIKPVSAETNTEPVDGQLYINHSYGYKIEVPEGWYPIEMEDMLILVADPDSLNKNIPVQTAILSAGPRDTLLNGALKDIPLESASLLLQSIIPQLLGPDIHMGDHESIVAGEIPAIGAPFQGQDENGVAVEGYIALTLNEKSAALLLGSAPANQWIFFKPIYEKILASFHFTDL